MMSEADFKAWGWRIPFLLSIVLVAMSLYIRMKLAESPLYASLKSQGKTSVAPLKESFGNWKNFGSSFSCSSARPPARALSGTPASFTHSHSCRAS